MIMTESSKPDFNTALAAFASGIILAKVLRSWSKRRSDPLSTVGDSSRLIAAWRALESLEDEDSRLFYDPLAFILAGKDHIETCTREAQRVMGLDLSSAHRFYKISLNAARTWWFDRQIEEALQLHPPVPSETSSVASWFQDGLKRAVGASISGSYRNKGISQVVVIGSGMDSRPWRLALPRGVRWYEIDRQEVLKAKTTVLKKSGAQLEANSLANRYQSSPAPTHVLNAASWTAVAADVGVPGWSRKLQRAGFDPQLDTLWVLEGLMMYLQPPQVSQLLTEAAKNSGPGSILVGHTITDELLLKLETGRHVEYPPFPRKLMKTWKSGLPLEPKHELQSLGWQLDAAFSRAEIAQDICDEEGSAGLFDFETRVGQGNDRNAVFFTATRLAELPSIDIQKNNNE